MRAMSRPATTPPSTPKPISSSSRVAGLRPLEISDSTSAIATAANSSGTQIPSLRPLSTLSPCRIRRGTRGSVTTACPSAASVGASTTARITASMTVNWPNTAAAATAPRAIVSGRPIPSRRTGRPTVRRSAPRSMRDASENNTSASVTSANPRTVAPELERSIPSSTSGPTSNPKATNRIAGVIGVRDSRPETAATPSSAIATRASAHSISAPHAISGDNGDPDGASTGCLPEDPAVVSAILAPVAAVVAPVVAPVVAVLDDGGRSDDRRRAGHRSADHAPATSASSGQRHVRLLAVRVGRPLRSRPAGPASQRGRWPRAGLPTDGSTRRTARPTVLIHEHGRDAAGFEDRADLLDVFLGQQHRQIGLQSRQLADVALVDVGQLGGLHRPVRVLAHDHEIEHANELTVDQRSQFGRHLTREVRPIGWELDGQVVDRSKHIKFTGFHCVASSPVVVNHPRPTMDRRRPAAITRSRRSLFFAAGRGTSSSYWRAIATRSSLSWSSMSWPLRSTETVRSSPVKRNGAR